MTRPKPYSLPDPGNIYYEIPGIARTTTLMDTTGKSTRAITINGSEKTLIMITAGQSLATDLITDTFTATNAAKIDNVTWHDGKCYAAATPLLGTSWNGSNATSVNFNHKIADGIISNAKFDRVIIIPTNLSGTTADIWEREGASSTEATGYWRCIAAAILKLNAQNINMNTTGVKWLIKWNQGESDTQVSTTQVAYANSMTKMINRINTYAPGIKWMIAKETWYIGTVSSAVQAAQTGLINGSTIFAGEDMDTNINATGRIGDNTHLNAAGGNTATTLGIAAITAITF